MFNIYFSHRRNTLKDMNKKDSYYYNYSNTGEEIRAYLIDWEKMDGLPKCNLYVPSDYVTLIKGLYHLGYIDDDKLLDVNLHIIKYSNLVISFGNYADTDMIAELKYAHEYKIPVYNMSNITATSIEALKFTIKLVLKAEGE